MNIGVLGTGEVGRTIATKLVELGHEVKMGGRSSAPEKAVAWAQEAGPLASVGTFRDAALHGELLFHCTAGAHAMAALGMAQPDALAGKILVDVSNPLDFSQGFPPRLAVSNDDSLGEQIQRAHPKTRVVKALNTMANPIMVNPRLIEEDHQCILCGDDADAKDAVWELLKTFGWRDAERLDLGGIDASRGTEAYLLLWTRIYGATKDGLWNLRIARPAQGATSKA